MAIPRLATPRFVVLFLLAIALVVFIAQNTAPALPLVFLGLQSQPLPLAVWLGGAIALGALTTLAIAALLPGGPLPTGGRTYQRYGQRLSPDDLREERSQEATAAGRSGRSSKQDTGTRNAGARDTVGGRGTARSVTGDRASRRTTAASRRDDWATAGPEWQDWSAMQSPAQWDDWEALSQAVAAAPDRQPGSGWLGGNRQRQEARVRESMQDLEEGWDGDSYDRYQPRGGSQVDDHLEDIGTGWDNGDSANDYGYDYGHDYERSQTPKTVYRDGSLYSQSYRDDANDTYTSSANRTAGGAAWDEEDWDQDWDGAPDGSYDDYGDTDDLNAPSVGPDGVVEADYRVIIPPYRGLDDDDERESDSDR